MRNPLHGESLDAQMQNFAATHHGVITRVELIELGYSPAGITRRLQSGILVRVRPRVFRVTAVQTSWTQQLYAVCRWLEPHVVASHRSAATLLNLGDVRHRRLEVTTASKRRRSSDVIVHVADEMSARDR